MDSNTHLVSLAHWSHLLYSSKLCMLFVQQGPHRRQLRKQRLGGGVEHRLVRNVLRIAGVAACALQRQEAL